MFFRMAARPDLEASLDELFGDQRRGLAVVFNAQDLFTRFRHALHQKPGERPQY